MEQNVEQRGEHSLKSKQARHEEQMRQKVIYAEAVNTF